MNGPGEWRGRALGGDLDGDSIPEILSFETPNTGLYPAFRARLYKRGLLGAYRLRKKASLPGFGPYEQPRPILFLDADGDGDLDVYLGTRRNEAPNRLWLNQGRGIFKDCTSSCLPKTKNPATHWRAVAGDLDGDGDLDILEGSGESLWNLRAGEVLLLNNGKGVFTDATAGRLPQTGSNATALALGDLDGDGDLDLVAGTSNDKTFPPGLKGIRIYLNDGKAKFTDVTGKRVPTNRQVDIYYLALGDVDGDGDLDVFAQALFMKDSFLLLNTGKGFFKDLGLSRFPPKVYGSCAAFLDVDEDGDLDLVGTVVLLNDGKGFFHYLPGALRGNLSGRISRFYLQPTSFLDLDGDGDKDILLQYLTPGSYTIYFNLRRQIHAPYLPALGRPYEIRVYGDPGDGVLPLLSKGKGNVPLGNLGTLFLSTQGMAALPLQWLNPSGTASVYLHIPRIPVLLGVDFYAQALLVKPGAKPKIHLTNALAETILGI